MQDNEFDYTRAGFDGFLSRSINNDFTGNNITNLNLVPAVISGQQVNYDQVQVSGALGDKLKIGNITLDGADGKISIFDDQGNELVRLGAL